MPPGPYVSPDRPDPRSLSVGTKGSIHGNPVQHLSSVARRLTKGSHVSSHVVVLLLPDFSVLSITRSLTVLSLMTPQQTPVVSKLNSATMSNDTHFLLHRIEHR